jgi:hypothetical protein
MSRTLRIPLLYNLLLAAGLLCLPLSVSAQAPTEPLSVSGVPNLDRNRDAGIAGRRLPDAAALDALTTLQGTQPSAVARWDAFSGSPDVVHGLAVDTGATSPEAAARSFLASNAALFGVSDDATLVLDASKSHDALGGHLLRFRQVYAGIPVHQAGVGVVLDGQNRVRAVSGPYYRDLSLSVTPSLSGLQAVAAAAADLAPHERSLTATALDVLSGSFGLIESQLGTLVTTPHPELTVYPTADGARLAWTFLYWSRNPFGLFRYTVDADTGQILARDNQVHTQNPLEMTADYFPTSPPVTPELQDDGAIVDDQGGETGTPAGMLRIALRKFDETNRVTGVAGRLTGTHALIQNALPTMLPFGQAAAGTWHFSADNPPLEARPDERDHLAEPAEHLDEISQFIYITSLIEYLDYLHRDGDAVHATGVGEGTFPDSYPNDRTPLTGTVHIANVLAPPEDPSDPEFVDQLMGLDNAFAVPLSQTIAGQEVVINPTFYGHGYLFNDLAIDFAVPLHEGTHATITPIAGFEGEPEGGALNEGQADLFAYTIGENTALGAYVVNAPRLRQALSDSGTDPDSFQWIRNAQSQIRYSQLGTRDDAFEVHRDGEIYAGAMWDLRELMLEFETGGNYLRPNQVTGAATDPISLGKETWERIFLGSMYVLGTLSPDTFVRARDAVIIADAMLYPVDSLDPASPGRHRALIEQVFAARELGANAAAPAGGRQTISTAVTSFAAGQERPAAPQNVTADARNLDGVQAVEVSWDGVPGAFAYQVLKRRPNAASPRLFAGVPGREYFDGDDPASLSGFTHSEYVLDGTTYLDLGQGLGRAPGLGLDSLDYEYVVRALRVAASGQVGVSDLSGTAALNLRTANVTTRLDARISNVGSSGDTFSFDQTLAHVGSGDVFTPIAFHVIGISEPSVTVANADNGGSGVNGDPAVFVYPGSLAPGETSAARRLEFHNPQGKLFTFTAVVFGRVAGTVAPATGSQPGDGEVDPATRPQTYTATEQYTGLVPLGSGGLILANGVDYVDVPFTAKASGTAVTGVLSADLGVDGVAPDLDFELRDGAGNVLATSGNLGSGETVSGVLAGGGDYVYRVIGFVNVGTMFTIVSEQTVTDPADANTGSETGAAADPFAGRLSMLANPLLGTVTGSLLN